MDKYTHRHKENVKGSFLWGSIIAILFIIIFALTSCGLRKSTVVKEYRIPYSGEITVLEAGSTVPEGAVFLGDLSIGDSGFTSSGRCKYDKVLFTAKKLAAQMGGNYLLITQHNHPSWMTTCHEINANVYYYKAKKNRRTEDEED